MSVLTFAVLDVQFCH